MSVGTVDAQTTLEHMKSLDCVILDEAGHCGAATREPGHEDMRSTVEKEDVRVDNRLPVSFYRIDAQSCSVRGRMSVCCGCRYKLRPSEGLCRGHEVHVSGDEDNCW